VVAPEAVAPVAEDAAKAASANTYVVQEGDDMTGVSIAFGVTAAAIRELNNLGDNDQLKPGQVIKLPADAQQ
jgi:LysM repeat protein